MPTKSKTGNVMDINNNNGNDDNMFMCRNTFYSSYYT